RARTGASAAPRARRRAGRGAAQRSWPRPGRRRVHRRTGGAAWESKRSLPYGLLLLEGNGLFVECRAVVRQGPALHFSGAAARHTHDHVGEPRPRVLPVERRRGRGVIRVRVIHADHFEPVAVELLLRPTERLRVDEIAVARRVGALIHERYEQHGHFAPVLHRAADEPARFGGIVRFAVLPDRVDVARLEYERHARTPRMSHPEGCARHCTVLKDSVSPSPRFSVGTHTRVSDISRITTPPFLPIGGIHSDSGPRSRGR